MTLDLIKYDNANVLEATWKDGGGVVKCHSYSDVQIDILRSDSLSMGTSLTEYEPMIADVIANIAPSVPTPIIIPQVVTMRQARLALRQNNLLTTIDNAVASSVNEDMKIEWEYAAEVRRDWASLIAMATQLGMTSAQLDDLFLLASTK